ncbi:MAG: citramalate synthase [Eubacteriaceae bacterium]|nr:citramalate synthase [Eubacteriaceae bacterium]
MPVETLDTTLRDGAQSFSISFSTADKLEIISLLDSFGIDIIECGNPYSNPRDKELFRLLSETRLKHARVAAFGQTAKKGIKPSEDENIQALLGSHAQVAVIVGKSSQVQAEAILKASGQENLDMVYSTVEFLKSKGMAVYYDAEHFFDAYKEDRLYAMHTLSAALSAGCDMAVLCDTNGASLPSFVYEASKDACNAHPGKIGIHCHDDRGMAVANSIAAVQAGCTHVQGTFNGYGERCGNASLAVVLPVLADEFGLLGDHIDLQKLTITAHAIATASELPLPESMPFVGVNAFAHKGGMHIDGMQKLEHAYEHIDPLAVGNKTKVLLSEVSGRGAVLEVLSRHLGHVEKDDERVALFLETLKKKEYGGYQYEGAQASLELLVLQTFGLFSLPYEVELYRVMGEKSIGSKSNIASAIVKVRVGNSAEIAAAEGNGPVNALDMALRRALESFYPALNSLSLTDYRVRVIDPKAATGAKVRVAMQSSDNITKKAYSTVGVSTDIIDASFKALLDAFAYHLFYSDAAMQGS